MVLSPELPPSGNLYHYASCIWPGALPEKKQIVLSEFFSKFILCFATLIYVLNFIFYLSFLNKPYVIAILDKSYQAVLS